MAWLVPMLARRAAHRVGARPGLRLRVVESASCGGNRVLCLVRADDQELLLGVTDAGITLLLVLAGPSPHHMAAPTTGGEGFVERLQRAWKRGNDRE